MGRARTVKRLLTETNTQPPIDWTQAKDQSTRPEGSIKEEKAPHIQTLSPLPPPSPLINLRLVWLQSKLNLLSIVIEKKQREGGKQRGHCRGYEEKWSCNESVNFSPTPANMLQDKMIIFIISSAANEIASSFLFFLNVLIIAIAYSRCFVLFFLFFSTHSRLEISVPTGFLPHKWVRCSLRQRREARGVTRKKKWPQKSALEDESGIVWPCVCFLHTFA